MGQWTCASDLEICEYNLMAHNEFVCAVTRKGEGPFRVRGYWDVVGNQLRMGNSPLAADPADLVLNGCDSFSARLPGGQSLRFTRSKQIATA